MILLNLILHGLQINPLFMFFVDESFYYKFDMDLMSKEEK